MLHRDRLYGLHAHAHVWGAFRENLDSSSVTTTGGVHVQGAFCACPDPPAVRFAGPIRWGRCGWYTVWPCSSSLQGGAVVLLQRKCCTSRRAVVGLAAQSERPAACATHTQKRDHGAHRCSRVCAENEPTLFDGGAVADSVLPRLARDSHRTWGALMAVQSRSIRLRLWRRFSKRSWENK